MSIADPRAFILANTRLTPTPHAPEIVLWVADEVTPLWRLTEEELGEMGLPPPFWAFAWAGGQGLARWLLDHPEESAGRAVIDFAAGSMFDPADKARDVATVGAQRPGHDLAMQDLRRDISVVVPALAPTDGAILGRHPDETDEFVVERLDAGDGAHRGWESMPRRA